MCWKRKKEENEGIGYYSLEELKVGMRVSILSLSKIYEEAIYLDKKTYKRDSNVIGKGTIVAIGLKDFLAKGIKRNEVYVISNAYDLTDESISEDPLEYDLEEWLEIQKQEQGNN